MHVLQKISKFLEVKIQIITDSNKIMIYLY